MNKFQTREKQAGNDPELFSRDKIVLRCENVSRVYVDGALRVEVLNNISLDVKQGSRIAIIGSSGSGKSTLMHILGGLDKPSAGNVLVTGVNINKLNDRLAGDLRNRALGFVYQFHHLMPEFTAMENVAMPLLIRGLNPAKACNLAQQMLEKVGLEHRLNHKPSELSGGERQRAAIARALVSEPDCLLADEPTGNLDRKTAEAVYSLMLALNKDSGISIVIVTHDERIADRMDITYVLEDGTLKKQD